MKVYIIFGASGQWEDYREWVESVWTDKEKAEIKLKYLQDKLEWNKKYQEEHYEELRKIDEDDWELEEHGGFWLEEYEVMG